MSKIAKLILLFLPVSLLFTGCGYNMGSIANPQIKTIAIAPIKNETYITNASEVMRHALADRFQVDGSYKIKNLSNADCILYGTITNIDMTAYGISHSQEGITYITQEFGLIIDFEFTIIVPGQSKPLIPSTKVVGQTIMQMPTDYYTAQQNALGQAAYQTALEVVAATSENW